MMTLVSRREGWYGNAERKYGSESRSVITGTVRRNAICSSIFFYNFYFYSHFSVTLSSASALRGLARFPRSVALHLRCSCGFSGVLSHTV